MKTVLQISDPHLMSERDGTLKGVPTFRSLEAVVCAARDKVPEPDAVIWSGDLSHEHTRAGYENLKSLIGDWLDRSHFIPGNHDDRAALIEVFPSHWATDTCVSFRGELDDWQLLGLDSHVPGEVKGALSEEQTEQLHFWLSENPHRPTLIFLHHPPVPVGCEWIEGILLENPGQFEMLVGRNPGPAGIFCGHIHQVFEGSFAGVPVHSCPSASFQFKPATSTLVFDLVPPGYRLIHLDEEGDDYSTEVIRLDKLEFPPEAD